MKLKEVDLSTFTKLLLAFILGCILTWAYLFPHKEEVPSNDKRVHVLEDSLVKVGNMIEVIKKDYTHIKGKLMNAEKEIIFYNRRLKGRKKIQINLNNQKDINLKLDSLIGDQ
jgi:hypothetical protein